MILYGRQHITDGDIQAVIDVLKSDFLTQVPTGPKSEQAIFDYTSAKFSVTTNSATSALHLACRALGLGQGDIILRVMMIIFVATINCALYCGAGVDFVDIDPQAFNLTSVQK